MASVTDAGRAVGHAAGAAMALLLIACAAPDAEGPPPSDHDTRYELELIECQQRARNRPNEAQLLAECNHPRIGGSSPPFARRVAIYFEDRREEAHENHEKR